LKKLATRIAVATLTALTLALASGTTALATYKWH
jgi:hypothetical protein